MKRAGLAMYHKVFPSPVPDHRKYVQITTSSLVIERSVVEIPCELHEVANNELILKADGLHVIKWWVDAPFAVHPDSMLPWHTLNQSWVKASLR